MASRSMMRSVSAPAADTAPPPSVQVALRSTPFQSSTTRRNLATSYRAFKSAWTTIEQVQVLSASCKRLGERAATVLMAVRQKLESIERAETSQKGAKVVLERSYEFQGNKNDGESGGKTIFKIQSTMLDLQAFAHDYLAKSNASRLTLLIDELAKTQLALTKLSSSLLSCISTYSLSSSDISASLWAEENVVDLAKDHAALPRLFQLSIMLKGQVYDRFTKDRKGAIPVNESPGQRRAAFVEWCLEQNPILKSGQTPVPASEGLPNLTSPSDPVTRQIPTRTIGLGLPSSLTPGRGGVLMTRAVTQPLLSSPANFSPPVEPTPHATLPPPIATESRTTSSKGSMKSVMELSSDATEEMEASSTSLPSEPPAEDIFSPAAAVTAHSVDEPFGSSSVTPQDTPSIEAPPVNLPASLEASDAQASHLNLKSDDTDEIAPHSQALDRSTSTVSSMAMTHSSSTGSLLFEPVLPSIEVEDIQTVVTEGASGVNNSKADFADAEREAPPKSQVETETMTQSEDQKPEEQSTQEVVSSTPPVIAQSGLDQQSGQSESFPSPGVNLNGSLLGLALGTPLPLSPQLEDPVVPPHSSEDIFLQPTSLSLLDPLPIDERSSPFLEPAKLAASPSLPPSPSLVVTSFDYEIPSDRNRAQPPLPEGAKRPYRVLSLDGGGLVGPIPQLLALKREFLANNDSTTPAQEFDLIVGTSSSALSALLLGQFGLSIDETLQICSQVSKQAFGLEGPASPSSTLKQTKPRRIGRWSRFFSRAGRSAANIPPPDRRMTLENALKQFIPAATAPLPRSRTRSQAAVLAFTKSHALTTSARAQECWLSNDSNLTLLEIVQASMALPPSSTSSSPASCYVTSPTSLNPATSALAYVQTSIGEEPSELVSLSLGYSLSSIPTNDLSKKRVSKTRLEELRLIKQVGAGNAAAAEALSKRIGRDVPGEGVTMHRIDPAFDARDLALRDEVEMVDSLKSQLFGKNATPIFPPASLRQHSPMGFLANRSPPGSPSSFVSQPPPLSPASISTKLADSSPKGGRIGSSRLNFFSSSSASTTSIARRSASSSDISTSYMTSFATSLPGSPHLSNERHRNLSLAFQGDDHNGMILRNGGDDDEGREEEGREILYHGDDLKDEAQGTSMRSSMSMDELYRSSNGSHLDYDQRTFSYENNVRHGLVRREGSLVDLRL